MSDGEVRLSSDAVGLLLEVLELREPVLSGAAVELRVPAAEVLQAAGLLMPDGHEAVSASLADHDDVPVSLTWSNRLEALCYFDPASGPVAVPTERLTRFGLDVPAVLAAMTAYLDLPQGQPAMPLINGLLWELGNARIGRRPLVPVWFARRLWDSTVRQQVAGVLLARPHPRQRVILTSTWPDRLASAVFPGTAVIAVLDVLHSADALAVDVDIVDARLGGVPLPQEAGPITLSLDGRQLRINGGEPIVFRSDRQIDAISRLVSAYHAGKRLRIREITDARTLNILFGGAKWKLLSPNLKSADGLWGLEP